MIFSELYGAYYNTVAAILTEAIDHPLTDRCMNEIIKKYAFSGECESFSVNLIFKYN